MQQPSVMNAVAQSNECDIQAMNAVAQCNECNIQAMNATPMQSMVFWALNRALQCGVNDIQDTPQVYTLLEKDITVILIHQGKVKKCFIFHMSFSTSIHDMLEYTVYGTSMISTTIFSEPIYCVLQTFQYIELGLTTVIRSVRYSVAFRFL